MSDIGNRIAAAPLQHSPFPYKVVDNVFPTEIFQGIKKNWPGPAAFLPEITGNHIAHLTRAEFWTALTPAQGEFWRSFAGGACMAVALASVQSFLSPIRQKYGQRIDCVEFAMLSLMEADEAYVSHVLHTHHWHDPTWLATNLIYVDDGESTTRGTTLYGIKPGNALSTAVWLAAQTGAWWGSSLLEVRATVPFVPNRLLSFHDNPTAWHGVENAKGPGQGRRRILRMHLRARRDLVQDFYGVSYDEYQEMRKVPTEDHRQLAWMRRDILALDAMPSPADAMPALMGPVLPPPAPIPAPPVAAAALA
jgi:hypothetical protein